MQPTDTRDYLAIIQNGLMPMATRPQKVVIVGAGMAGLTAAYELQRAGHEPLVLEAQPRVGGRIYTLREPFSDGLYAEAGAMRIPRVHDLTMAYIEKFQLEYSPFTMGNANAYYFINGRRTRVSEAKANPDGLGFAVAAHERGKSYAQLWEEAIQPIVKKLESGGAHAWDEIVAEYDEFSIREFLESRKWSEGAIEMYGLLADQEAIMNTSFLELLREEVGNYYTNMIELDGGMDHLPRAFMPALRSRIRFGAKMIALDQAPTSVTIHYETAAGRMAATGDYAIITAPFPVLRHIEVLKPFSRAKQRAIRQAHYDASAKILFQCRRRFWEEDDGIFGGGTISDLPVRVMYYPDHHRETGRGVMLASYTWGEDAERWASLSPRDRIEQALEDVAQIHPQITTEFEVGVSHVWHNAEFAAGAFALFDPGQQTLLYNAIIAPEGRIHFAGEHASLAHAWIQGAIESGLRAAREIHRASFGNE
ncbi:MAG: flavin monoamine oxidase family protein [Chloroflexi bacterium]|nr:flavin monoamine oxidase family protein [Chloroflexota bacterium]